MVSSSRMADCEQWATTSEQRVKPNTAVTWTIDPFMDVGLCGYSPPFRMKSAIIDMSITLTEPSPSTSN